MTPPFRRFPDYDSKVFTYKTTDAVELKLDVLFPLEAINKTTPVLLHYHGGFLIIGDRASLQPSWLINACVQRRWVFVSPDYRLLPESTAHDAVNDAVEAYEWVSQSLSTALTMNTGPVILAGSSAGAYLALTTATIVPTKPRALFLLYGMLDPTGNRYTTQGTNILGFPSVETGPILDQFLPRSNKRRPALPGYPFPDDLSTDPRFAPIQAVHIEALFPDMITGILGMSHSLRSQNREASIPDSSRRLFPVTFADFAPLPPTLVLHGKNDTAVPFQSSLSTAEKLQASSVDVTTEFLDDAEHGFDVFLGDVDLEDTASQVTVTSAIKGLLNVLAFLDRVTD